MKVVQHALSQLQNNLFDPNHGRINLGRRSDDMVGVKTQRIFPSPSVLSDALIALLFYFA
jgi:hypothetical protein